MHDVAVKKCTAVWLLTVHLQRLYRVQVWCQLLSQHANAVVQRVLICTLTVCGSARAGQLQLVWLIANTVGGIAVPVSSDAH